MAAEAQHASSRERPCMSAGDHGRRILEARDEARTTASQSDIRKYLCNGQRPFDDCGDPAAEAEVVIGRVVGLATVLGLAFEDATKIREGRDQQASELMQCSARDLARAMEGISCLAALAGFYASEAQG